MFRDNNERISAAAYAKISGRTLPNTADTSRPPFLPPDNFLALGRLKTGEMNKTEAAYDRHLWEQHHAGKIVWHKFEGVKLRLADNTFFTADFAVLSADMAFEIHEVKGGFWMDDSRIKIKVAASLYPFRFIGVMPIPKSKGGGWKVEEF